MMYVGNDECLKCIQSDTAQPPGTGELPQMLLTESSQLALAEALDGLNKAVSYLNRFTTGTDIYGKMLQDILAFLVESHSIIQERTKELKCSNIISHVGDNDSVGQCMEYVAFHSDDQTSACDTDIKDPTTDASKYMTQYIITYPPDAEVTEHYSNSLPDLGQQFLEIKDETFLSHIDSDQDICVAQSESITGNDHFQIHKMNVEHNEGYDRNNALDCIMEGQLLHTTIAKKIDGLLSLPRVSKDDEQHDLKQNPGNFTSESTQDEKVVSMHEGADVDISEDSTDETQIQCDSNLGDLDYKSVLKQGSEPESVHKSEHGLEQESVEHGLEQESVNESEHGLGKESVDESENGSEQESVHESEYGLEKESVNEPEHGLEQESIEKPEHGLEQESVDEPETGSEYENMLGLNEESVVGNLVLKTESSEKDDNTEIQLYLVRCDEEDANICSQISTVIKKKKVRSHVAGDDAVVPHKCDQCGKSLATSAGLTRHLRLHSGEKPFQCTLCGQKFHHQNALTQHTKKLHSETRLPHECTQCDKCFLSPSLLRDHERTHRGDKRFMCDICSTGFYWPSHLKRHMRLHSGQRSHVCKLCQKSFVYAWNLEEHLKVHSGLKPYECGICGQVFGHANSVKVHMHKHSGLRAYQCDICGKRFTESGVLKRHQIVHTGEKPFQCSLCSLKFGWKVSLHKHMQKFHKQ